MPVGFVRLLVGEPAQWAIVASLVFIYWAGSPPNPSLTEAVERGASTVQAKIAIER